MRTREALVLVVLAAIGATGTAARQPPPAAAWDAADATVQRLPASTFSDLPEPVRHDLVRRGCTIPQSYAATRPHNVIRGAFRSADAIDWAVLCSRKRTSAILVYWQGDPRTVDTLADHADRSGLAVVTTNVIGYTRSITVATPAEIQRHHDDYGGPTPPPLTHDGIADGLEGGSSVWFWHDGRWLKLTGADR